MTKERAAQRRLRPAPRTTPVLSFVITAKGGHARSAPLLR
jgi:hypothetical protein